MMRIAGFSVCTMLAGAAVAQPAVPSPATPPQAEAAQQPTTKLEVKPLGAVPVVITNVTVITMTDAGTLPKRTVVVRDGKIAEITDKPVSLKGSTEVDGSGKFLIPGLCDMHVHFPPFAGDQGDPSWRAAALLLANGVTTARGMIGHDAHIELRRRMATGELVGPLCYFAGPPMNAQAHKTADKAREAVAAQKARGFDLIKSHRVIVPQVYEAIQNTAREQRIAVAGHVDNEVGLDRALAATMQIEHMDGLLAAICPPGAEHGWAQMPAPHVKDAADLTQVPAVVARIKKAGVTVTPTAALFDLIADVNTTNETLLKKPGIKYIMPNAVKQWEQQRQHTVDNGPFSDGELGPWFTRVRAAFVAELNKQGVPLMAGSDSPQFFLVTGFALHEELEALVRAGLSPAQALKAATATPADYLRSLPNKGSGAGIDPDFGVIAAGKRADLVLLSADPTNDIANTRKIEAVCVRGKWLDRAALDDLLKQIEASVAPKKPQE
ncbi:MAG TPA: amidohydrolase family protein [Phycisphaerales bacterium]|nr:amidohydrolase family protein [Phycisphaerales bacterium]